MKTKVRNMFIPNGNQVANQFIIETPEGTYFQSYRSIIAFIDKKTGERTLAEYYWDYSRTTGKYRNEFLGEYIADTRAKIESGEYKLADLN